MWQYCALAAVTRPETLFQNIDYIDWQYSGSNVMFMQNREGADMWRTEWWMVVCVCIQSSIPTLDSCPVTFYVQTMRLQSAKKCTSKHETVNKFSSNFKKQHLFCFKDRDDWLVASLQHNTERKKTKNNTILFSSHKQQYKSKLSFGKQNCP